MSTNQSASTETNDNVSQLPKHYTPEKDLYNWTAKSRPFKRRNREYWVTLVAIASLLSFILFLAEGAMPVVLIISILFLYYVLSTVEPHDVSFKATDRGIRVEDKLTEWSMLTKFWITNRMGSTTLNFVTKNFPWTLELMIQDKDVSKLKSVVSEYLPEGEPERNTLDKASDWVSKRILRT